MSAKNIPSHSHSPGLRLLRQTFASRSAQMGAVILLVLVLASLFAPLLSNYNPEEIDPSSTLLKPSTSHPMGTDGVGRDAFARFLYGGRLSLFIGLIAIGIGATIGVLLGLASGYFGGWLDALISWLTDILLAFPDLLLALAIIAILGPGLVNAMVAVGISFVPSFMRLTRSNVLAIRETAYVEAARALGDSDLEIIFLHILPNTMRTLLVLVTLGIGSSILAGAALSFLGLGVQPPTPEWGSMLNAGQKFVRQGWWLTVFPGLGIFLTILSVNLIGDALSDAVTGTVVYKK